MLIINNLAEYLGQEPLALTIGTFDGLHNGHITILDELKAKAKTKNLKTAVLTFSPHPRTILDSDYSDLKLLFSDREKILRFEEIGIDLLFITPFNKDFSNLSAQEFMQQILLNKLNMKHIVLGYDSKFGKDRLGDLQFLSTNALHYSFGITQINKQVVEDITISSSKIRNALNNGNIQLANKLLGYKYQLSGIVVKGEQLGRNMGYPTANIQPENEQKLVPQEGIYAVNIIYQSLKLPSMLYIGTRPTVNGMTRSIEANILDFNKDLYGEILTIEFLSFVRNDMKFNTVDDLIKQIKEDEKEIRAFFKQYNE